MKSKLTCILILALGLLAIAAEAKEGGDQYPNGAENWFAGAVPPKGSYFINYFGYYHGELRDGSGKKVNLGGTVPSVDAVFDALRWIQITPLKILGADYGMHVIVPLVNQKMNLGGEKSQFSAGDITINPIILGWHGKEWHAGTGLDINIPTGHFDKNDPRVCVGTHYYSFEPIFGVSYVGKAGWEASSKFMLNLKTTNQETKYHSGTDLHMDYLVGKHIKGWSVGASGYILKQFTDDKIDGAVVPEVPGLWGAGRKGQVIAIGPNVSYTTKKHMTFVAYWQHETAVRNRFGGDKVWFKMIIPTASLFPPQKKS